MKIRELTEVLQSPYATKQANLPDSMITGRTFVKFEAEASAGPLDIMFTITNKDKINLLEIDFSVDDNTELTQLGDQWRVLSTVRDVIERNLIKIINQYKVNQIKFTADLDEESRTSLYATRGVKFISAILKNQMPDANWQFSTRRGPFLEYYIWSLTSKITESMTKIYPFSGPQVFQHSDSDIVEFRSNLPSGTLSVHFIVEKSDQLLEISFDVDGEQELTGGGNQFAIFATVIAIIKSNLAKIVKQYNIKHVEFSATRDEPSRVRLYQRRMMPILDQVFASPELSDQNWVSSINADDYKAKFIWQLQDSTLN